MALASGVAAVDQFRERTANALQVAQARLNHLQFSHRERAGAAAVRGFTELEERFHFIERKTDVLRTADETKPRDGVRAVAPHAAQAALRFREQAAPLIL